LTERFAELLAKGRAGQLTREESEELARRLNALILDPLDTGRPGFESKHAFAPSDVAGRLRAVDWFSQCGQPLALDLSMDVERVPTWREATASCMGEVWEGVQLEAQNQLALWLSRHDRENFQRWNERVDRHKMAVVDPLAERAWEPYQRKRELDPAIIHSVRWDILGALMENTYLGSGHRCFFFLELLAVYKAGHFPCGWRGEWPDGKLVVF
jgi:hypothetical protein